MPCSGTDELGSFTISLSGGSSLRFREASIDALRWLNTLACGCTTRSDSTPAGSQPYTRNVLGGRQNMEELVAVATRSKLNLAPSFWSPGMQEEVHVEMCDAVSA